MTSQNDIVKAKKRRNNMNNGKTNNKSTKKIEDINNQIEEMKLELERNKKQC